LTEAVLLITEDDAFRDEYDYLKRFVSSDKRARLERFHFFADAQRSLLGELLARVLICERAGLNNAQLVFGVNPYGKPVLENDRHIHFNVSHSGGYVVCAIDDVPVGVDVEGINKDNTELAKRFFAPDEIDYIVQASTEEQMVRFCRIWTQKESCIKREGMGLSKSLSSFSVLKGEEEGLFYHLVFHNHEAVCHICSEKRALPVCKILDKVDFLARAHVLRV